MISAVDPAEAIFTASSRISFESHTDTTLEPPLAAVSSCLVSPFAARHAFSASASLEMSRLSFASDRPPRIVVRRLLKSCAIPPARRPSASNRFALMSSSGVSPISSGLRKTITTPCGLESGPYDARAVQTMGSGSEPATTTDWSLMRGRGPFAESARSAGLSLALPVWRLTSEKTWLKGRPTAPSTGRRRSRAAVGLARSTLPPASVAITPSARAASTSSWMAFVTGSDGAAGS